MNPLRFLIGLLIIAIGLILLGQNLNWWSPNIWNVIWQFWPVLLIVIGLRKLLSNDVSFTIASILALVLIGMAIFTSYSPVTQQIEIRNIFQSTSSEQRNFQKGLETDSNDSFVLKLGSEYDLKVIGATTNKIQVDISGPEALIDRLDFTKSGDTISLVLKSGFMIGWWSDGLRGTITMPATITFSTELSGAGEVTVENHQGKLTIDNSGAVSLTHGYQAINPSVELSGAAKINLDHCEGETQLDLSGATHVTARNCTISQLTAQASGASSVDIQAGTVTDAKLEASGASHITIPKPSGTIGQNSFGASSIELR